MTPTILHVSDTHLGKRQYRNNERLQDYADAFDESITKAIELSVDGVIHTGDLFDAPNPNVPVVNQCLDVLSRLEDENIPFYGIVGNHERKRDEQWLDLVNRFNLVEKLDREPTYVGEGSQRFALYGIDAVRKPEWDSKDFTLQPPDENAFSILCMHELVSPPVPSHMADYETKELLERLGTNIDGLAMGDYHEAESAVVNNTRVWYPGSTEKTSRSESPAHVVIELGLTDGELEKTKHLLHQPREFIEVPIEFGSGDGLEFLKKQVSKYNFLGENGKPSVTIAILEGEKTSVSPRQTHNILAENGAAVTKVVDNRERLDKNDIDTEKIDSGEIESLIDDRISDLDLKHISEDLERIIRDGDVATTNLRDKGSQLIDHQHIEKSENED